MKIYNQLKSFLCETFTSRNSSGLMKNLLFSFSLSMLSALISLPMLAQGRLEPIQKVEIGKNQEFLVNGKPFFPIMSWLQSERIYPQLRDLGFNTFAAARDLEAVREAGCYAISEFRQGVKDNGYMLAWIFDDEPDMPSGQGEKAKPRQDPFEVSKKSIQIKNAEPKHLLLMTLTGHFTREESTYPLSVREKIYPEFTKEPDVVGFDIYPIYGSGYASRLNWVGSGVAQLRELTKKPVYAWIESSKGSRWMTYELQPDVLPIHTRNEVWQAIINGAVGIGYFTHAWRPEFKEFAPTPEMQAEMKRLNNQITMLAPAILANTSGKTINMTLGDGLYCQFKATEYDGYVYIFALNSDLGPGAETAKQFDPIYPRSGQAVFTIKGLKKGTKIEVVDEHRTIVAGKNKFVDEFAPLAEHIYRFKK